ncbi:MAG: S41 family peptidase [Planctomycetota bacterium]|nr:MAG: S41 family peptidase [Planctomycetota bacterium]
MPLATLLLLMAPPAQEGANPQLEPLVAEAEAEAAAPARIFALADAVHPADEESWVEQLRERLQDASPKASLLLARLLANADSAEGVPALAVLVNGADQELAMAALATLALPAFRVDPAAQGFLGDWLTGREAGADPQRYAEACRVLYEIGDSARRRAARRYLAAQLTSSAPEARTAAALALARTGDMDDTAVAEELERLSRGSGAEAALAQALLEQHDAEERWKAKLEELDRALAEKDEAMTGKATSPGDLRIVANVRDLVKALHMEAGQFQDEELVEAAANGLLQRLDPHSDYMSGKQLKEFMFDIHPEYGGIGAYVNTIDGLFTIVRPIYSGPAYRLGLRSDDKVLEVDGWSTIDQPTDAIIKRLKGPPGTEVKVRIARRGWSEPQEFAIVREQVRIPTMYSEILPGGVLYVELQQFDDDAGPQIRKAIDDARGAGQLRGVVLDLRNNSGGLLSQAVEVCELFLPKDSLIVSTRTKASKEERYHTEREPVIPADLPLVILLNKFSASASEIVSGALAVYDRATLVGERSHGKGSVQNLIPLRSLPDEPFEDLNRDGLWEEGEPYKDTNGSGLYEFGPRVKLTIAYYYLPDGSSIHTQRDHEGRVTDPGGVQPDMTVAWDPIDPYLIQEIEHYLDPKDRFREYAQQIYLDDPLLAVALAEFDGRDSTRYPGFEEFYADLDTRLSSDEVRRWVRTRLRAVVSDARGKVFPGDGLFQGDFVEDLQLQQAIRQVLEHAGVAAEQYPAEYAGLAKTGAVAADAPREG